MVTSQCVCPIGATGPPSDIEAVTTTGATAQGFTFDTQGDSPGAVPTILLDAFVDWLGIPSLFFMQNGKINGGYAGRATHHRCIGPISAGLSCEGSPEGTPRVASHGGPKLARAANWIRIMRRIFGPP
jgi:hypothetical protein